MGYGRPPSMMDAVSTSAIFDSGWAIPQKQD
jgi:hypothetical protein